MRAFLRVLKFSMQDMYRNMSLSLMNILILVLMLLSVNAMIFVHKTTDKATSVIKDQIDVSIYFNHEASEERVQELTQYILSFPEVVEHTFLTNEQALDQFKQRYGENEKIMEAINELGRNPLGPVIVVKTKEPSDYNKIIKALDVPEYRNTIEARTFEDTQVAIDKIDTVTQKVEIFSFALSVFFGLIAFIIIFNTIRVAIYTQRKQISIKKLVGATNWFVQGPYLLSALVYTLFATIITMGLVLFAANAIDPQFAGVFQQTDFLTSYVRSSIIFLFLTQFILVLVLTMASSLLAMRKYLRV